MKRLKCQNMENEDSNERSIIFSIFDFYNPLCIFTPTHFDTIPRNSNKRLKKGTKIQYYYCIPYRSRYRIRNNGPWTVKRKTDNIRSTIGGYRSQISVEILWNRVILVKIDRISFYFFVTCRFVVKQDC